jgi:hypothetical protein
MKEVKERERKRKSWRRDINMQRERFQWQRERDKVLGERNIKIMTQIQTDTVKTNEL